MTTDIVARLRVLAAEFPTFNGIMDSEWTNAADEIERMRKERDEAQVDQRLIDELWERRTDAAQMNERIRQLLGNTEQLRAERDEARREVCAWCNTDESGCVKSGSHETARARGWDCFKEREEADYNNHQCRTTDGE